MVRALLISLALALTLPASAPAGINVFVGTSTIPGVNATVTVPPIDGTGVGAAPAVSSGATGFANVWVDADGGTCTRGPSAAYSDAAACSTLDAAWDASSAGDTIRVKANASTYGAQTITGSKASTTAIYGDTTGAGVTLGALDTEAADHMDLQDVDVSVGSSVSGWTPGNTQTGTRVDVLGGRPYMNASGADGWTWRDSTFGGTTSLERRCSDGTNHEPIDMIGSANLLLERIDFWPQKANQTPDATCGGDSNFHMEDIRIDQGAHDITLSGVNFRDGDESGSGHVFITQSPPGSGEPYNLNFYNNYFSDITSASYSIQINGVVGTCLNYRWAYNFLAQEANISCATKTNMSWTGNLGPKPSGTCNGTYVKNVWQHNVNTACGTDTWVNGPAFGSGSLGVSSGDLTAGSSAIDAGENAQCTSLLGNLDRHGVTRTGACDAGSDEF